MTAARLQDHTMKAIKWLAVRGYTGRIWRSAWLQNSAPLGESTNDLVLVNPMFATEGEEHIQSWPFHDRYGVVRIAIQGKTEAQIDSIFAELKANHSVAVLYTHRVRDGFVADITPTMWTYFLSKYDQGVTEGWLEAVTPEMLLEFSGVKIRQGMGGAWAAEWPNVDGLITTTQLPQPKSRAPSHLGARAFALVKFGLMGLTKSEQERKHLERFHLRAIGVPLAVITYAYILHWVYLNLITDQFRYMGYYYTTPNPESIVYMVLAAIVTAWFLPARINRPSALVLWLLYVVAVAPSILVPTYTGYLTDGQAATSGAAIAGCYILATLLTKRTKPIAPFRADVSPTTFWLLVGLVSAGIYAVVAVTLGLRLQFVSLFDVYDLRDEYKAGLAGASGIVGYLVSTQANVINPLIITRGIYSKRWGLVLIGALGQAILFSGTGFKTILFSLPALILFALMFRANLQPRAIWILWGATIMAIAAAIIDNIQGGITWTTLFARRFLLTPGMLMSAYVAYYNEHDFAQLAHSVLAPWVQNQYQFAPARMIGMSITGNPGAAFNANIFADGYANFGYAGMVGAALILGVYLRVVDRVAHGLPVAVSGLILIMPAIALSNTSVLTAMLSHGLAVAVLVLAIAPRSRWGKKPRLTASADTSRNLSRHQRTPLTPGQSGHQDHPRTGPSARKVPSAQGSASPMRAPVPH